MYKGNATQVNVILLSLAGESGYTDGVPRYSILCDVICAEMYVHHQSLSCSIHAGKYKNVSAFFSLPDTEMAYVFWIDIFTQINETLLSR